MADQMKLKRQDCVYIESHNMDMWKEKKKKKCGHVHISTHFIPFRQNSHVNICFIGMIADRVNQTVSFQYVCRHSRNNKQRGLCIIPITHINQPSPPINLPRRHFVTDAEMML